MAAIVALHSRISPTEIRTKTFHLTNRSDVGRYPYDITMGELEP